MMSLSPVHLLSNGRAIDIFRKHLPNITTLTLIHIILFSLISSISAYSTDSEDFRKSCKIDTDCRDATKECKNGFCHCLPFYDDVHDVSSGQDKSCMKSYLSNCNRTAFCNIYKHLICVQDEGFGGTCVCNNRESDMEYDPFLETCAAIPGATCDLGDHAGPYGIKCVKNSECVTDESRKRDRYFFGKCVCSEGYVQSGARCVRKLGTECELDEDCDQIGMECSNGKCNCNRERMYDEMTHECRLKAGRRCEAGNEDGICIEKASCFPGGADMGWICVCKAGYHKDKHGNCTNDTNESGCGEETGEIGTRVFDEKRGRCSIRIGGQCRNEGLNLCVSHAFCGTGKRCQCFVGYRVTERNMCEKIAETIQAGPTENGLTYSAAGLNRESFEFLMLPVIIIFILSGYDLALGPF